MGTFTASLTPSPVAARSTRRLPWAGLLRMVFVAVLTATLLDSAIATAADGVLKRRNIDNLTPEELAAYEHAIQILKDRSDQNPYNQTGFLWQAWVHNCPATWVPNDGGPDDRSPACDFWEPERGPFYQPDPVDAYTRLHPGMCEHGKDLFLPWHRAEFYYFEKILQAADPDGTVTDSRGLTGPSTSQVTVPYWNWIRPPSGDRYPEAFENPESPLYHENRARDPVAPGLAYPFASPHLVAYMIYFLEWPEFVGFERAMQGGYGLFEAVSHNPMHSLYMAGDMASPSTAALDPGFFSFHAFIDLLYEQWIQIHGVDSITSKEIFLRGDQPDEIVDPPDFDPGQGMPSMGRVELYLDTANLGYAYEIDEADQLVSREEVERVLGLDDREDPPIFGASARSLMSRLLQGGGYQPDHSPDIVRTIETSIPMPNSEIAGHRFFALLDRNPDEADVSYQMDAYLYPKQAPFDPSSRPFRDRYLAGTGVHWGTGSVHHMEQPSPMAIEISRPVRDLAQNGSGGELWNVSLAVSVLPSLTTFGEPSVVHVTP